MSQHHHHHHDDHLHHHHGEDAHVHQHQVALTAPGFSLLRLSVAQRLMGVMALLLVLWSLVLWAIR